MIPIATLHAQRRRLAELCEVRRPLSDDEIAEVLRLDELERLRAAKRKWCAANRDSERQRTAAWRQARREGGADAR